MEHGREDDSSEGELSAVNSVNGEDVDDMEMSDDYYQAKLKELLYAEGDSTLGDALMVLLASSITSNLTWKSLFDKVRDDACLLPKPNLFQQIGSIRTLQRYVSRLVHMDIDKETASSKTGNNAEMVNLPFKQRLINALRVMKFSKDKIGFYFGFDGIQVYENTHRNLWLLVLGVRGTRLRLLVNAWLGEGYPDPNEVFRDFIDEMNEVIKNGFHLPNGKHIKV